MKARLHLFARYAAILGVALNLTVMVANHGFMPVIDPWVHAQGRWKIAEHGDHLLFLCDRFRLIGQQTLLAKLGEPLSDWSPTAGLGQFLMTASFTVSIGDILISTAIAMLALCWLLSRTHKRRKGSA